MLNHSIVARSLAAGAALCLVTAAGAQTTGSHPDVSGVWKMDTTKFEKHDAQLAALTLTVMLRGDTMVIKTDGIDVGHPPFTFTTRYLADELLSAPTTAAGGPSGLNRLSWDGSTLVLSAVMKRPDRTINVEERWTIDASGKTLSREQTAVDGPRVSRQRLLFTRQ